MSHRHIYNYFLPTLLNMVTINMFNLLYIIRKYKIRHKNNDENNF